jgi:hypothetical protein
MSLPRRRSRSRSATAAGGILLSVDGNQSVEAVTDAIVGELAKMADTAPER